MSEPTEIVARALPLGVGATAILDLWGVLLHYALKQPLPNYTFVGRWIGHFPRGQFAHDNIAKAAPIAIETPLGWLAHYLTGIVFATVLVAIFGIGWTNAPTLAPALAVGVLSVVVPYLVMQPAFGFGVAASRTPKPNAARLRSLVSHTVFGIGLYVAAIATAPMFRG